MTPENHQLMMRANRLLGAGLAEANLVKLDDLERANERFLEIVATDQPRQSTILGILAYEQKVLREEDLLQYCVDNEGLGLVDLRGYDVHDDVKKTIDFGVCWATWSVPFDHDEDFNFIATAYYLSPAVRSFWEKQFTGPILWFGTTLEVVGDHLEKIAAERTAPPPPNPAGTRSPFGGPAGTRSPFGSSKNPFPKGSGTPFIKPVASSILAKATTTTSPFPAKANPPPPPAPGTN